MCVKPPSGPGAEVDGGEGVDPVPRVQREVEPRPGQRPRVLKQITFWISAVSKLKKNQTTLWCLNVKGKMVLVRIL